MSASVALLTGPWQFLQGLRARHIGVHRVLGRGYAAAVLIGWLASIPVGLPAETGAVASAGFLTLGVCWVVTTGMAITRVLGGRIAAHRHAATAAGFTSGKDD